MGNILEGAIQGWFRHKSILEDGFIVPCSREIPEYYEPFIINPSLYIEFVNLDTSNPLKILEFVNKYGFLYNEPHILSDKYGKRDFNYKDLYPSINADKSSQAWNEYLNRNDDVAYLNYKGIKKLSFGSGIIENYKFEINRMKIIISLWEGIENKDNEKLILAYEQFADIYYPFISDEDLNDYKDNYYMLVYKLNNHLLIPIEWELTLTKSSIRLDGFGLGQDEFYFYRKWESGDLLTIMYYMLFLDMTGGMEVIRKCNYKNCDNYFIVSKENKQRKHCFEGNCSIKKHANNYNNTRRNPENKSYDPIFVMHNNKLTSLRQYKNRAAIGLNEFLKEEINLRYDKDRKKFNTLKQKNSNNKFNNIDEYENELDKVIASFKKFLSKYEKYKEEE